MPPMPTYTTWWQHLFKKRFKCFKFRVDKNDAFEFTERTDERKKEQTYANKVTNIQRWGLAAQNLKGEAKIGQSSFFNGLAQ